MKSNLLFFLKAMLVTLDIAFRDKQDFKFLDATGRYFPKALKQKAIDRRTVKTRADRTLDSPENGTSRLYLPTPNVLPPFLGTDFRQMLRINFDQKVCVRANEKNFPR